MDLYFVALGPVTARGRVEVWRPEGCGFNRGSGLKRMGKRNRSPSLPSIVSLAYCHNIDN